MDLGLDGAVAIVGGASAGIGRATAEALVAEGARVVLVARRAAPLDEVATALGAGRALALPGDLADPDIPARAVGAALASFGRLDVLVNNTGGPPVGAASETGEGAWRAAVEGLLLATVRLTTAALPHLRASGRGRVVTVTSGAVLEPEPGLVLSNSLRAAVTGWSRTLAREEAPHGVTVNCVAPGSIDTARLGDFYAREADPAAARRRDEAAIPAGRFGTPAELAAAVAFLCSRQAAYVTGTTLLVDGGVARGLLA